MVRNYDRDLYKPRHLIENFFAKLKQFRVSATRYDKTAQNFLAGVHIASAAILLVYRHALSCLTAVSLSILDHKGFS